MIQEARRVADNGSIKGGTSRLIAAPLKLWPVPKPGLYPMLKCCTVRLSVILTATFLEQKGVQRDLADCRHSLLSFVGDCFAHYFLRPESIQPVLVYLPPRESCCGEVKCSWLVLRCVRVDIFELGCDKLKGKYMQSRIKVRQTNCSPRWHSV